MGPGEIVERAASWASFLRSFEMMEHVMEAMSIKPIEGQISDKLTPGRAIRKLCIECVGSAHEIKDCQGDQLYDGPCLFYPYRMRRGRPSVRLIRRHCIYCMGGNPRAVKDCPSPACPLLPYRMGKNPKHAGKHGRFPVKGHAISVFPS